jgi:glycolate oxidase
VKKPEMSLETWEAILPNILTDLYDWTVNRRTISGEHGIGHKRKAFINQALEPATIELMKPLKRLSIRENILNPGKIFDLE